MVPKKPESMTAVDKLQQFFILHGEKLGFGIVLLVLFWCLSTVFTVERYPHQPEELVSVVQSKRQAFQSSDPANDQSFQQLQVFPYDHQARETLAFRVTDIGPFNRGLDTGKKRPDPELLPLEDLQARSKQAIVLYRFAPSLEEGEALDGNPPVPTPGGRRAQGRTSPATRTSPPRGTRSIPLPTSAGPKKGPPLPAFGGPASAGESGPGVFAEGGAAGGESEGQGYAPRSATPRLRYMIVVTGRVPLEKQLEIYRKAFKDCRITDPRLDYPRYFTFLVERRDLTAGEKDWKPINVRRFLEEEVPRWHLASEIVSAKHVVPLQLRRGRGWTGFTSPLPMLADENWGTEATANQIPLLTEMNAEEFQNTTTEPKDDVFPDLFPDQAPDSADGESPAGSEKSRTGSGLLPTPGKGIAGRGLPGGPISPGGPIGINPGGEMPGTGMGMGMGRNDGAYEGGGPSLLTKRPEADILLRFIDLDVEPGHDYVYRIRLVVHNPNYGINAKYLVRRDSAKRPYKMTDWVELPEPVRVTVTREVIAGRVRQSPVRDRQSLVVVVRDPDNGARVMSELRVYRGYLLNKTIREVYRKHPTHNLVEKLRDYPIRTNMLVLDFMGGQSVPGLGSRPVEVPSRVLVLHEDGRLEVRKEITEDVDAHYELARQRLTELAELAEETESENAGRTNSLNPDQAGGIDVNPSFEFEEFSPTPKKRSRRKRR